MSEVEDKYGIITHIYSSNNVPQPQAKTETRKPNPDGMVYLNEIPNERYRITITNKKTMVEVFSLEEVVDKYKYYVDYNRGILYTDPSLYGVSLEIFYMSIGYLMINASRIMWNNNLGTDKNLETLFVNVQQGLTYLEGVGDASGLITSLGNATSSAQTIYTSLEALNNSASSNVSSLTSLNSTANGLKTYFGSVDTTGSALYTANNLKSALTTLNSNANSVATTLGGSDKTGNTSGLIYEANESIATLNNLLTAGQLYIDNDGCFHVRRQLADNTWEDVMYIDTDNTLTVDKLKVKGADSNVTITGTGEKFVRMETTENEPVFLYMTNKNSSGNSRTSRIGYYADHDSLFLETKSDFTLRGTDSTPTKNADIDFNVCGRVIASEFKTGAGEYVLHSSNLNGVVANDNKIKFY